MKQRLLVAALSLLAIPLAAQPPAATTPANPAAPVVATRTAPPPGFTQTIVLWPAGAPLAHGTSEGDIPKLFTYPAAGAGPHSAVIVMPGGGYTHLVMPQEGAQEAQWLAAHGISAFVLEYRLSPAYVYPAPMLDASRAIRYVRSHAAELAVKPDAIGVWGFSAGGHLSGYMATIHKAGDPAATDPIDRVSDRPDFAIISYGVLSLDLYARAGTVPLQTLIGQHPTQTAIDAVDPFKHVSADTSPCLIYSTTGDKTVDPRNAAEFYEALKAAGVPAELHIFELGAHGTHMGVDQPPAMRELTVFPTLLANWLQLHGWMPAQTQ
jgi:acetyl esterase/lipase